MHVNTLQVNTNIVGGYFSAEQIYLLAIIQCKDNNELIDFKDFDKQSGFVDELKQNKTIHFKIDGKGYSIPSEDCVLLPLPYTSAEELSKYFAENLAQKLSESYDNLKYISVCVNEGIGQGAEYRKDL